MRRAHVRLMLPVGPVGPGFFGQLSLLRRMHGPCAYSVEGDKEHVQPDRNQLLHLLDSCSRAGSLESRGKLLAKQVQQRVMRSRLAKGCESQLAVSARVIRKITASQVHYQWHTHDGL